MAMKTFYKMIRPVSNYKITLRIILIFFWVLLFGPRMLAQEVNFMSDSQNVDEDVVSGQTTITITVNPVNTTDPVTVNYSVSGTATGGGIDYSISPASQVVIPANQATGTITVTIVDEGIIDEYSNLLNYLREYIQNEECIISQKDQADIINKIDHIEKNDLKLLDDISVPELF